MSDIYAIGHERFARLSGCARHRVREYRERADRRLYQAHRRHEGAGRDRRQHLGQRRLSREHAAHRRPLPRRRRAPFGRRPRAHRNRRHLARADRQRPDRAEQVGAQLTSFFNAATTLAADPTATTPRAQMLAAADQAAYAFTQTGKSLTALSAELDASAEQSVATLNGLAATLGQGQRGAAAHARTAPPRRRCWAISATRCSNR